MKLQIHTIFRNLILAGASIFGLLGCRNANDAGNTEVEKASVDSLRNEDYRPAFHFTPAKNWMNDPNGMFFLDGTYHLYFQHYPEDNVWGPMHWGHATSRDLITWEEQDIALYPDEKGYIFSGSAVVDHQNSSGFGKDGEPPVVAIFTYHDPEGEKQGRNDYQSQAIAYSLDKGHSWTKYKGNPVLSNPGMKDFRDPKVIWDEVNEQWLMALATTDRTLFYSSANLKEWNKLSEFGEGYAAQNGVWECPDLFPMKVNGSDEIKWVLIQSLNPGGYNGGSGTQYFVGDFNGKEFTPVEAMSDLQERHPYWIDFGRDNYAGVTWANIPKEDGRKIFIGWMSNWLYGQEVPTTTWRSAMTIARELKLVRVDDEYLLTSEPVDELKSYRGASISRKNVEISADSIVLNSKEVNLETAEIRFEISDTKGEDLEFILANSAGERFVFGYDQQADEFHIDRANAGDIDFSEKFADTRSTAPRIADSSGLNAIIILDKMSIEIFFDNGKTVMTEIFFPTRPWESFSIVSENKEVNLDSIQAWPLELKRENREE